MPSYAGKRKNGVEFVPGLASDAGGEWRTEASHYRRSARRRERRGPDTAGSRANAFERAGLQGAIDGRPRKSIRGLRRTWERHDAAIGRPAWSTERILALRTGQRAVRLAADSTVRARIRGAAAHGFARESREAEAAFGDF